MKKIKASSYVVIGIMAIALIAILLSLGMEHWKSKLLPLILSGLILILGVIEFRAGIFKGDNEADMNEESRRILRGYLITGVWVGGFLVAISLLGFLIAIPLFTFFYMKLNGSTWLGAIVLTSFILGFMYVISEPLAGIKLYRGIIPIYLAELI